MTNDASQPGAGEDTSTVEVARGDIRECTQCGLFQLLPCEPGELDDSPHAPDEMVVRCVRCRASLRRTVRHTFNKALSCAASAAALFVFSLLMPFMDLRVVGRLSRANVFTGPDALSHDGMWSIAAVVLFTLVAMPALKLSVALATLIGVRGTNPPAWLPWVFGWLPLVSPWAMIEVFLLGVAVAYTRMRDLAHVDVGPALFALCGVMLATVAMDASLDRDAVWSVLQRRLGQRHPPDSGRGQLVGCHSCGLVRHTEEGSRCVRCSHRVHARKPNSVSRVWALTLAACLLYIPANVRPVMTVLRFGKGGPHTIWSGVVELAADRLWPLAAIVFLASMVIPMVKLLGLISMLVLTHRRSPSYLSHRVRLFRFINVIGRWSMLDIFALTALAALVRLGFLATVLPGDGAVAFAGVVVLTMLATELFDPRLMWDAAGVDSGASAAARALSERSCMEHDPA